MLSYIKECRKQERSSHHPLWLYTTFHSPVTQASLWAGKCSCLVPGVTIYYGFSGTVSISSILSCCPHKCIWSCQTLWPDFLVEKICSLWLLLIISVVELGCGNLHEFFKPSWASKFLTWKLLGKWRGCLERVISNFLKALEQVLNSILYGTTICDMDENGGDVVEVGDSPRCIPEKCPLMHFLWNLCLWNMQFENPWTDDL